MKIPMYQVDAFTDTLFGGNPAAVCIPENALPESLMQAIAAENNLAETAFLLQRTGDYEIRWFTPVVEVDLCGHATLAAAFALFHYCGFSGDEISFHSPRSGPLKVSRSGSLLTLDFPADVFERAPTPKGIANALGTLPLETYKGKTDYMLVYRSEEEVLQLAPDFVMMASVEARGVIVTAPGTESDFVSRFFAPQSGINEDPVTGSAHTTLTPYWAAVLGKNELSAIQLSPRRGYLQCTHKGDRVTISGKAVGFMEGVIEV